VGVSIPWCVAEYSDPSAGLMPSRGVNHSGSAFLDVSEQLITADAAVRMFVRTRNFVDSHAASEIYVLR
jgi:hypothetical protein